MRVSNRATYAKNRKATRFTQETLVRAYRRKTKMAKIAQAFNAWHHQVSGAATRRGVSFCCQHAGHLVIAFAVALPAPQTTFGRVGSRRTRVELVRVSHAARILHKAAVMSAIQSL